MHKMCVWGRNYFPKAPKHLEVFAVHVYMIVEVKLHVKLWVFTYLKSYLVFCFILPYTLLTLEIKFEYCNVAFF